MVQYPLEDWGCLDVITIVGEGEPSLYLSLGPLISELKKRTKKPIAVITNGALLYDKDVQKALMLADIVLPSLDACTAECFKTINRPHGDLQFSEVIEGLISFSNQYKGQLWLEIMLISGMNDTPESIECFQTLLSKIHYHKLYLNTPIRPPAESFASIVNHTKMVEISQKLNGISIDLLESEGFSSSITDDYEAVLSIIKRHPMNQFEISCFLISRGTTNTDLLFETLSTEEQISKIDYMGYVTYRLK